MSEPTPSQAAALARSAVVSREVHAHPGRFRVLTGDRPTGPLHLGHYLVTLVNRVRLQDLGVEVLVLVADYQVLTDQVAGRRLADTVRGVLVDYLAAGIDPHRSTIFTHSAVPALNELVLPFLSLVSDAELHRNPTVKAETEATGRPPSGLMLTYPVHQAADILFCHANLVPVGLDQLPHLETARLVARRFAERYGPLFAEPDALLSDTPVLAGLDGQKMSKTRGNGIALGATDDETAALIRRAPTDSERHIGYDPVGRPAVANLLDLLAAVTGDDPHDLADGIGAAGAGRLKQQVTEAVNELLRPLRVRRRAFSDDRAHLDAVLDEGNDRARTIAERTLADVHDRLGMTYVVQLLCAYAKLPVLAVVHQVEREEPLKRSETATPRQVRHRLGKELIDQLCADYESGSPTRELMKRYAISKHSVTRLLQARGVLVRKRDALTTTELSRAMELYSAGNSAGAVARIMEKPTSTIYHALRRAGTTTRSQKAASHMRYGIE